MYRKYFSKTLDTDELKNRNRYAPDGLRFCNGSCHEYIDKTKFTGNSSKTIKMICNDCRSLISLVDNQIKQNKFTLDEFRSNPSIIDGFDGDITMTKKCSNCKETKPLTLFNTGKSQCKPCKMIINKKRNINIDMEIKEIENNKINFDNLKSILNNIPKGKLTYIISHYQIGRKSSDTKPIMVEKAINFFQNSQNPYLCSGGCGFILKEQKIKCGKCAEKTIRHKNSGTLSVLEFEEKFDDIINNLSEIDHHNDTIRYNFDQLYKIAKKLNLPVRQKMIRSERVLLINTHLLQLSKTEEETEIINDKIIKTQTEIKLNGISVLSREDGFINATQLCKAGGKRFTNWYQLDGTKDLIKELERHLSENAETVITVPKFIDIIKGKNASSWIHPDLAIQLAQWISPKFALQVSRWIRELSITGIVKVGEEKTSQELLQLQKEMKHLEKKHNNILKHRSHYKFKKGAVFYIFSRIVEDKPVYKVGIDHKDINVRLGQHRTTCPELRLEYLVYTSKNSLIESMMLERYKENLRPHENHEHIYNSDILSLVSTVKIMIDICNIEHEVEKDIEKYN
jgi:hypothetical protein